MVSAQDFETTINIKKSHHETPFHEVYTVDLEQGWKTSSWKDPEILKHQCTLFNSKPQFEDLKKYFSAMLEG